MIDVIILAQGSQTRIPALTHPKQLVRLPACANTPLMDRTLVQLWHGRNPGDIRITVVGWRWFVDHYDVSEIIPPYRPRVFTLDDPGNSSLKGLHRYVTSDIGKMGAYAIVASGGDRGLNVTTRSITRRVVLLGDVAYSWAALHALMHPTRLITIACTSDISPSDGELWGLSWGPAGDATVMEHLSKALDKHPPYHDTYQPGQMRRLLYALEDGGHRSVRHHIDDYTRDIDLPKHTEAAYLKTLSECAAADDALNGIQWATT